MIGELTALKGTLERKRALFLLPLKALVNDKYHHFNRTYGAFGLKTIRATGEHSDDVPALMRGRYDVCLMTYEKCSALVLGNPHILEQVGTIVVDEVQMIADQSRGANLEFLITLLMMRRRQGIEPQLILLSAVIGDTNRLERWLGARLLRRTERPVPLSEGILCADGSFRYISPSGEERTEPCIAPQYGKGSSQDWIIPLVRKLVSEGKQVIVFREEKGKTRGCAAYLANSLGLPPAQAALDALPRGDLSNASQTLREVLAGGMAFHNADLDREERRIIEEQFRAPNTSLGVIVATTTLAMGINTPASAVVIAGLDHPGSQPYSVAEYKNLVGRAGRLGYTEEGASYVITTSPQEEHRIWTNYVRGNPEDLSSRFLDTDPRSLIIRVLAASRSTTGLTEEEIVAFLEASFGVFQQVHTNQGWKWSADKLRSALGELSHHQLVMTNDGKCYLTPLGRFAGEAGVEVETIIRLVDALRNATPTEINDAALIAAAQLTVELDKVLFPLNKKSTQKEPQTWYRELQGQRVPSALLQAMRSIAQDQHQGTLRAKKAVACLLWMSNTPLVEVERIMTQFGGAQGGAAGAIRAVALRTCDLLPTVVNIAQELHSGLDVSERQNRLLARLELGLPDNIVDVAMQAGANLARRDYLRLIASNLFSVDAIESSNDEALLACVGNDPEKLAVLRQAVQSYRKQEEESAPVAPILPQPAS